MCQLVEPVILMYDIKCTIYHIPTKKLKHSIFHLFRAYTSSTSNLQCLRIEVGGANMKDLLWKTANCQTEKFTAVCVQRDCDPFNLGF